MDQIYVGMTVEDATSPIGVVESVEDDPATGAPRIVVQRDDGDLLVLTSGMFMVVGDVLHIDEAEREVSLPTDEATRSQLGAAAAEPGSKNERTIGG